MAHHTVIYRLADTWADHCLAFKVPVLDVQVLAAQGRVLEAYRLLQERRAEKGMCAIGSGHPPGAPFVVEILGTSGPGAALPKAQLREASGAPAPSTANGEPTPAHASFVSAAPRLGRQVFVAVSYRRSRPFGSSKVDVAIVQRIAISEQVFVLTPLCGGASNG